MNAQCSLCVSLVWLRVCFRLTTTQKWSNSSKVTGHSVTLWRKNRHSQTYLPHQGWSWVTNSHFPPLSPGSALRRFQWHAEDQLQGEWGLPDRGLESRPDQNEMNIQSEAKPHGLICPFTMPVIILRVSSAAPPPRWEGSLAESESSSFGCRKKKSFCVGRGQREKEKERKNLQQHPTKGTHESLGEAGWWWCWSGWRGRGLEVSTLARIIDSSTRRVRYHAGGHAEEDSIIQGCEEGGAFKIMSVCVFPPIPLLSIRHVSLTLLNIRSHFSIQGRLANVPLWYTHADARWRSSM